MAMHPRKDWYELTRATNWTPSYVTEEQLFPERMSGHMGIPLENGKAMMSPIRHPIRST